MCPDEDDHFEAITGVVYEWYVQQRVNGVPVKDVEPISAAIRSPDTVKVGKMKIYGSK